MTELSQQKNNGVRVVTESQEKNVSAKSETTENIFCSFFLLFFFRSFFLIFLKSRQPNSKIGENDGSCISAIIRSPLLRYWYGWRTQQKIFAESFGNCGDNVEYDVLYDATWKVIKYDEAGFFSSIFFRSWIFLDFVFSFLFVGKKQPFFHFIWTTLR